MGNNGHSEEEIKDFVENGWSFQVKKNARMCASDIVLYVKYIYR
jgi:hypothetical protein